METITRKQYDKLVQKIYDTLISNPENGLGERGECRDEATRVVNEWIEEAGVAVLPDEEEIKERISKLRSTIPHCKTREEANALQREIDELEGSLDS